MGMKRSVFSNRVVAFVLAVSVLMSFVGVLPASAASKTFDGYGVLAPTQCGIAGNEGSEGLCAGGAQKGFDSRGWLGYAQYERSRPQLKNPSRRFTTKRLTCGVGAKRL